MEKTHGKSIDLSRLKQRVLADLGAQSAYWTAKAAELAADTIDVTACPVCRSTLSSEVARIHDFPWHQCAACSHVFNARRPSDEALNRFYGASDEDVNHADDYTDETVRAYRRDQVARPKAEYVTRFAAPPGRWLDVGCGNGDLLAVAGELGYQGVGLEPNRASAEIARSAFSLEVHEEPLGSFASDRASEFDIVSFIGLLDLVADPMAYLRDAARLLKPGGVVFASFPNFESMSTAAQTTYPDKVICRHMYPATLNAYTARSAERAFRDSGLELAGVWYFGMDTYETINNLALGSSGFAGSPLHALMMQSMNELQAAVDRLELCDKFHAVARKPG